MRNRRPNDPDPGRKSEGVLIRLAVLLVGIFALASALAYVITAIAAFI